MSLNFLDDLDKNSGKSKYQRFSISLGIENFCVLVPFESSNIFESAVSELRPRSQIQLLEILNQYNGIME